VRPIQWDKGERNRVPDTLRKVFKGEWDQVYRDPGLKWEKDATYGKK